MKALYRLFATFTLLGLLEASHQRSMRWHLLSKSPKKTWNYFVHDTVALPFVNNLS